MHEVRLYLLCGLPGAGKTSRANQIRQSVPVICSSADDWVTALGMSLVDYEFRFRLQTRLASHAGELLRHGSSVVVEFGSWSRDERARIRSMAREAGAKTELHYLNAQVDELVQRVRARGGPAADALVNDVLLRYGARFEAPTREEIASFDRYVGPGEAWTLP